VPKLLSGFNVKVVWAWALRRLAITTEYGTKKRTGIFIRLSSVGNWIKKSIPLAFGKSIELSIFSNLTVTNDDLDAKVMMNAILILPIFRLTSRDAGDRVLPQPKKDRITVFVFRT
jgi:hypothetical protein